MPDRTTLVSPVVHRVVLVLDRPEVDLLAPDPLLARAHVGVDDAVAIGELVLDGGLGLVVGVDLDAQLGECVLDRERRDLAGDGLLAGDHQRQLLGSDHLEAHATAVDLGATAGRQAGRRVQRAELAERGLDLGRGDPLGRGHAVDRELQRPREADADLVTVLHRLVERGRDDVAVGDLDVLGLEHLADGVAHGAHLLGLTVDRQRHRGGQRRIADRGAGDGEGDDPDQSGQGCLAAEDCLEGCCELRVSVEGHDSPNVVLSGPRVPVRSARATVARTWGSGEAATTASPEWDRGSSSLHWSGSFPIPAVASTQAGTPAGLQTRVHPSGGEL